MQGETYQCYLDCIAEFLKEGKVESKWRDLITGGVPVTKTLESKEDVGVGDVSKGYVNFETEHGLIEKSSPVNISRRRKETKG